MPQVQSAALGHFDFGAPVGQKLGTAAQADVVVSTVVDANTVTLSDGVTTVTFEYDDDVTITGGNVLVDLGADDDAAQVNLAAAIVASALRMTAVAVTDTVTITAETNEGNEAAGNAYTLVRVGAPVTVQDFGVVTLGVNQAAHAVAAEFRVKAGIGGKLRILFEAPDAVADYQVTVQVAPTRPATLETPSLYVNTTAALNQTAVVDLVVAPRTTRDAVVFLRPGADLFFRIVASGGARGSVQIRGDQSMDIIKI